MRNEIEKREAPRADQVQSLDPGLGGVSENAFDVQLKRAETSDGSRYLSYTGAISVPRNLGGVITGVLGLDQRPVAAPRQ